MLSFQIPNMTCGHCVRAVTEAVQTADPDATLVADLATHQVQVQTTAAREVIVQQLEAAGYRPA